MQLERNLNIFEKMCVKNYHLLKYEKWLNQKLAHVLNMMHILEEKIIKSVQNN